MLYVAAVCMYIYMCVVRLFRPRGKVLAQYFGHRGLQHMQWTYTLYRLRECHLYHSVIDKRGNETGNADRKLYKVRTDHVRFVNNEIEENGGDLIDVYQHQQRFQHVGSETGSNILRAVGRDICDVSSLVLVENPEILGCLSKYPFLH